ncbi:MAG TPA: FAD-dependent oxidoreductase, partial [Gammaproteobacteria bacterium]|nr:FAD-dependent oxidoreductase [Gammaproteobacteria bacterium]
MQQFDIAVIGGGLVGASFARAISGSGLRTVLIDKTPAAALYDAALDNRGLAIAYTTQQSLHHFKLWTGLSANSHSIAHVHVSEQGKFGFTKLSAQTCGLPALGYVISASHLGAAL